MSGELRSTLAVSDQPAWANPSVTALQRVSAIGSAQNTPNFLSNLDCTLTTYRLVGSSTMQTGCFTPTAFGLLDSDSDVVIFNGTDEGLPLLPNSAHQVLAPWPKALNLVALDAVNSGGSQVNLYKNPLPELQDQRNYLGQLIGKQLTAPPELPLYDGAGQRLVINAQTLAFSDNGSWLVGEAMSGSFVRINLASLQVTPFAQSFGALGSPALLSSLVTISDDGRYVAIQNTAASSLVVYDLSTCQSGATSWQTSGCQRHEYWPYVQGHVPGIKFMRRLRFLNDGLLSFEVTTSSDTTSGIYELAPTAAITSLIDYLGLGDSYTSGEGAFDYRAGTDTTDNHCHLSINSYPLLLTRDLFGISGNSVACSGAVIRDVGSTSSSYRGQAVAAPTQAQLQQNQPLLQSIQTNYLPGYLSQQAFVRQYQPGTLTVSVGGNDIGFGDIVQRCVLPHISLHLSDSTCYNTYEDRLEAMQLIDRTVPRWTALYKQLQAESPTTSIYAIGYPQIIYDAGSCALNVHLSKSELEFAVELTAYLNKSIQQAAQNAGLPYVDISQALAGHRLCEARSYDTAVNGLTAGKDAGVLGVRAIGSESYHPTAFGQQLIEQSILRQTDNLRRQPATAVAGDSSSLLNVPRSGRSPTVLLPVHILGQSVVPTGTTVPINLDGQSTGLVPGNDYTVWLDGATGSNVGTLTADDSGTVTGAVSIPPSVSSGGHTIDVTGQNQAGEPIEATQPLYITPNSSDSDSDGVADNDDSCPYAVNSGVDADQDGIDDTCDGFIGQVADNGSQAGGTSNDSSDNQSTGGTIPGGAGPGGQGSDKSGIGSSSTATSVLQPSTGIPPQAIPTDSIQVSVVVSTQTAATKLVAAGVKVGSPSQPTAVLTQRSLPRAKQPGRPQQPILARRPVIAPPMLSKVQRLILADLWLLVVLLIVYIFDLERRRTIAAETDVQNA